MLGIAAKKGFVEAVTVMLSRGADVNSLNWLSETALHHAAHGGYPAMVDVLLRQPDIDLNNQTVHGCSALHLAAAAKQDHILAQLLEVEGINVNLVDKVCFLLLLLLSPTPYFCYFCYFFQFQFFAHF